MRFRPKSVSLFRPPKRYRSHEWLPLNIMMPVGTETGGGPFSLDDYPHADGPLAAFDDPSVRTIVLQWGTRLGKTTLCLGLLAFVAVTNPRNMMFAAPTQSAAERVIGERLYPMFEASCRELRKQLLAKHRRSVSKVKLDACRIFVGYSGSSSALADVGAYFGIANEIDKWDSTESTEADPLKLYLNRFKGFVDHKIILESTPSIKGKSRIERLTTKAKQHLRFCQCPHCGEYQVLKKGDGQSPGGIKWEHDSKGKSEETLAYATAYYECEKCQKHIENHHRATLLRSGIWVPIGCKIGTDGAIAGTPLNDGSDSHSFGPLASWYALTQTWGDFARQWVAAQGKPKELQDVFNSYMAVTWEVRRTKTEPETVGENLAGTHSREEVPQEAEFLTVTVDRQRAEGNFCPWVVMAHGAEDRSWVVDYGTCALLKTVWEEVIRKQYIVAETDDILIARMSGVDSGWDAAGTYAFCKEHEEDTISLKGSPNDLGGKEYHEVTLGANRQGAGHQLLHVNTNHWEENLHNRLADLRANEPGSLTLFKEARYDIPFLTDLCNGTRSDDLNKRLEVKNEWIKKDEDLPNDYRDCIKYGLCLAMYLRDKDADDERPVYDLPPGHDQRRSSYDERY